MQFARRLLTSRPPCWAAGTYLPSFLTTDACPLANLTFLERPISNLLFFFWISFRACFALFCVDQYFFFFRFTFRSISSNFFTIFISDKSTVRHTVVHFPQYRTSGFTFSCSHTAIEKVLQWRSLPHSWPQLLSHLVGFYRGTYRVLPFFLDQCRTVRIPCSAFTSSLHFDVGSGSKDQKCTWKSSIVAPNPALEPGSSLSSFAPQRKSKIINLT